jgi:hypothetical protein
MEDKPVGYVIGSLSHGDFFAGSRESGGVEHMLYVPTPGAAMRFADTADAERRLKHLERFDLCICPLFDFGDRWAVEWPSR